MPSRPPSRPAPRSPRAASADEPLPHWVVEELRRVTPAERAPEALAHLSTAAQAFMDGRHDAALSAAKRAKSAAPRDATTRELIGLSAYRLQRWEEALRELRAYRRLSGDTAHIPIEMDVLRAMGRGSDVEEAWEALQRLGGEDETVDEARVVYGSYLLDEGDARRAWEVTGPERLGAEPSESQARVWFVAARAARALGDRGTARQIYEALERADEAMPGLDELNRLTSA